MPLLGTLKTMPLTDLLQWVGSARLTGTLQVERNKVSKAILFQEGQVVGCTSDDPPERLGQFLIARGKISEETLRAALLQQETRRKHLGMILVEIGALGPDELSSHLEAKAEETIFSLFDWPDAVFRFQQGACDEANIFPISLRVEDVLLRGLKRFDEIQRIRAVFHDPGIVLMRTDKRPPAELFKNEMARKLFESIDGKRTVADILLHVHGSEYVVTKFLFELHRNSYVQIAGINRIAPPLAETAPPAPPAEQIDLPAKPATTPPPEASPQPSVAQQPVPERTESAAGTDLDSHLSRAFGPNFTSEPAAPLPAASAAPAPPAEAPLLAEIPAVEPPLAGASTETGATVDLQVESIEQSDAFRLSQRLEKARNYMAASEFESALEILDALYREYPGDESLRRLSVEAEVAFAEKAYRHYLPPSKIPRLTRPVDESTKEKISPTEFFLLSRMDGTWDIKSIIQVAPLREVDTLRTLKRMRENGVIELHDPEPSSR